MVVCIVLIKPERLAADRGNQKTLRVFRARATTRLRPGYLGSHRYVLPMGSTMGI